MTTTQTHCNELNSTCASRIINGNQRFVLFKHNHCDFDNPFEGLSLNPSNCQSDFNFFFLPALLGGFFFFFFNTFACTSGNFFYKHLSLLPCCHLHCYQRLLVKAGCQAGLLMYPSDASAVCVWKMALTPVGYS